jgi:8-amino-7-oxononanoate synthase
MRDTRSWIQEELEHRKKSGLYRSLARYDHLIDFCSNDYLGLGRDRVLETSIQHYLDHWKCSSYASTGSRLISGHHAYHSETEDLIARHHGAEAALLMDSGYMANHGLITALGQRGMDYILDAHCHASIVRSAHQSMAEHVYKFKHNNLAALEQKLEQSKLRKVVVIESVYSMDGDLADVRAIIALCEKYNAALIVDEAHAFGWLGPQRIGENYKKNSALLARVFTYGKGAGCHGAAIVCSGEMKEFLINTSAPFIYSTATTAHLAAAVRSAYDYVIQHEERTKKLMENIARWNNHAHHTPPATSPIQIIRTPEAKTWAERAVKAGFGVKAILPPTVSEEHICIRVCLHSYQKEEDIERLIATIRP